MGDFDKKYVIREAENILEEFSKKDKEERKEIIKLRKDLKKIKKVNIALKVMSGLMLVALIMLIA